MNNDYLRTDPIESSEKNYEIQQIGLDGNVLATLSVEAGSGEAAIKQISKVAEGTETITVTLNDEVINEMGVDYWHKRVRGRN
ncbi:hypothetical protein [Stieleria varia]|uniref:Uncharacterized protein n=1 Tax=Stieleria varia TaxID=2528005 RepID=A0A5C6AQ43_9BACT|nr:hypothetical protein [Stieleria varia]TWU01102.1 hypothetical protein Pla52n_44740 [Stieleria varia]